MHWKCSAAEWGKVGHSKWQINDHWLMQLGAMHNIYYSYFGQSTRMVDSGIFIDKICWFYPNRESTFWTMHAILKLQVPILAMRNNKMGHRINKMWTLINKVGHRNVKLVDTYQQVGFKKQQNGSRVLYLIHSQLCNFTSSVWFYNFTHNVKFYTLWVILQTLM